MSKNAFCFWAGVVLHRPSTFAAFSERVSLIVPLLFSLQALVFDFDRRTKEHIFYFGRWPLAVSRLEEGELNSRGFSNPWNTSRFYN
jgi:hypothetical protein